MINGQTDTMAFFSVKTLLIPLELVLVSVVRLVRWTFIRSIVVSSLESKTLLSGFASSLVIYTEKVQ